MDFNKLTAGLAIDEDKENGIELLLRFCESLRLRGFEKKMVDHLEKSILKIERTLQEHEEITGENELNNQCHEILKRIGYSILDISTDLFVKDLPIKQLINFFYVFNYITNRSKKISNSEKISFNLKHVSLTWDENSRTSHSKNVDKTEAIYFFNRDVSQSKEYILKLAHNTIKNNTPLTPTIISSILKLKYFADIARIKELQLDRLEIYVTDETVKSISISLPFQEYTHRYGELLWEMDIVIKNERNLSKVGYLLWSLGTTLESIDGVATEISDFGEGSLWARVKISFKDLVAKEETKEVLSNTRDALVNLGNTTSELGKHPPKEGSNAKKLSKKEFDGLSPTGLQNSLDVESRVLDNRMRQADLESKELDNKLKKIELIERLSDLAANGILQIDELQIDINEVLFFKKIGSEVLPGEPIDDIEKGRRGSIEDDSHSSY